MLHNITTCSENITHFVYWLLLLLRQVTYIWFDWEINLRGKLAEKSLKNLDKPIPYQAAAVTSLLPWWKSRAVCFYKFSFFFFY